jgi:hypothetical protein
MRSLLLLLCTVGAVLVGCDSSTTPAASTTPGFVGVWKTDTTVSYQGTPIHTVWVRTALASGTGFDSLSTAVTQGAVSTTYKYASSFVWSVSGSDVKIQFASCSADTLSSGVWQTANCDSLGFPAETVPNGASPSLSVIHSIQEGIILTLRKK